ncbi:ATP-binding protein [Bacteriovoracales bacterium]|nr:ATP-binding protein [Bacteriovoracales bacterium]
MYSSLYKEISEVEDRLKQNLAEVLYSEDYEVIKTILKSELKKEEVESVVILDDNKKKVLVGLKKKAKKEFLIMNNISILKSSLRKFEGAIFYRPDIEEERELTGWYILFVDEKLIERKLNNELVRIFLMFFLLIISMIILIFVLIDRLVVRPIQNASEVSQLITKGDFSKKVDSKFITGSNNEISILSYSINEMADEIDLLTTGLKNEVDAQTKEIQIQNKSFLDLLSNLDQGFLIINSLGHITNEPTKKTQKILGLNPKNKNVTDVFKLNKTEKKGFGKWLNHCFIGAIPFKDLLALSLKRLEGFEGKVINLEYKPIYGGTKRKKIEKVICVLNDITHEVNLNKKMEYAKEKSEMILKLVEQPIEFLDIITELQRLLYEYGNSPKAFSMEQLFRNFHTLKARFSNFKIKDIVNRIHALEGKIFEHRELENSLEKITKEMDELPDNIVRTGLSFQIDNTAIKKVSEEVKSDIRFKVHNLDLFLKDYLKENRNIIELAQSCLNSGENFDDLHNAKEELLKINEVITKKFLNKNLGDIFSRYKNIVAQIGEDQGKKINFFVEKTDINVAPGFYKDFLDSLGHVFRNAVDHGIEETEERIDQNKKEKSSITVFFKRRGLFHFQIGIRDDGRGIDPSKIFGVANTNKLFDQIPLEELTDFELIQLIFEPNFTTKKKATTLSGRGVGMDAVKKCAEDIEGKVWVESSLGEGTLFIAELPIFKA